MIQHCAPTDDEINFITQKYSMSKVGPSQLKFLPSPKKPTAKEASTPFDVVIAQVCLVFARGDLAKLREKSRHHEMK